MTSEHEPLSMIFESAEPMDPLAESEQALAKNRAKVGSARPSSLLYTYGVGSVMDLPQFSIMPAGLDDWEPIWRRRPNVPTIEEPRLLKVVQLHLGPRVQQLRPFPWQPTARVMSKEGSDLGIPARVFPQWLRCTGCDYLGPLSRFSYTNTHPFRPGRRTKPRWPRSWACIWRRTSSPGTPAHPACCVTFSGTSSTSPASPTVSWSRPPGRRSHRLSPTRSGTRS